MKEPNEEYPTSDFYFLGMFSLPDNYLSHIGKVY